MNIVVVGAGTVGFDLAVNLRRARHDVSLVEIDPQRCASIREKLDILVVEGPGSSPNALEEAGIQDAQMVLAVTSVDEVNILVCGLAAQSGVVRRIARIRNPEFAGRRSRVDMAKLGITRFIDPERISVRIIDQIVRIPDAVEAFGFHEGQILIVRHMMKDGMPIVGSSLAEIIERAGPHRLLAVALRRTGADRIPAGNDVLQVGDDVTTVIPRGSLPTYFEFLGLSGKEVRKAVVAGDGLTAMLLCETLKEWVADVVLIDPDAEHGKLAAERLNGVEVLHGDPTEEDMLREVNAAGADVFMGAGRSTTPNVMSALLARAQGTPCVFAVSYEPEHDHLYREIGVQHVVSPRRAMSQEIMDLIHRGHISMEIPLRDMEFEAIEIIAEERSKITKGPLHKVWRPFHGKAIVGAVIHNGAACIPSGETVVAADDDVIVVTTPKLVGKIEAHFGKR
ncbi:Trk system potassium transporter TrkA [Candidatus Eisenbacteria bacterium]|uniref:Trk system potassium uptake protein TrkA n=1 Tax=Eiseniibacteriota bacterium TaxID=2212470 RepID=A0ABV6YI57_UNCEI